MKFSRGVFVAIIGVLAIALVMRLVVAPEQSLEIVSKRNSSSGIMDFYIEDETVHIVAGITIRNHTDSPQRFKLTGKSDVDYESGLITSPTLFGYNEDLSTDEFMINSKETATFTVIFTGQHGHNNQKADRLIPEISLQLIE